MNNFITENIKVLIVDDEDLLRSALTYSIESAGYTVQQASCANEAIDLMGKDVLPVVMLLDMGMPPSKHTSDEGMKVLRFVLDNQLSVKVIVLTGQETDKTAYLAISSGAFDYLKKPISEENLLSSIKRAALFHHQIEKMQEQDNSQQIKMDIKLGDGVKQVRNQAEEKILRKILNKTSFNVHETGRQLGLKRENVYYLIKKYQISRPDN